MKKSSRQLSGAEKTGDHSGDRSGRSVQPVLRGQRRGRGNRRGSDADDERQRWSDTSPGKPGSGLPWNVERIRPG